MHKKNEEKYMDTEMINCFFSRDLDTVYVTHEQNYNTVPLYDIILALYYTLY